MISKKQLNNIVNMILASLICFSFVYGKISSLMFDYDPLKFYIVICGLLILFFICSLNKYTLILSSGIASISAVAFLIYLVVVFSPSKVIFQIYSFISWSMNYIQEITPVSTIYRVYLAAIICILISLFVFIFIVRKFNFYVIATYGGVFFILQWYYNYMVSYGAFYLFIFTMLICFLKHIYEKKSLSESNSYISPSVFVAWIAPLCAIILVLILILPSSYGIGESKWLDKSLNSMYTFFTNMFDSYKAFEYFSLEPSGFNDSSRKLGGKVHLNKKLVLKVDAPRVTYLKGACKEIYTGYSWKNKKRNYAPAILDYGVTNTDIYELTKGISIFSDNNSEDTGRYFYSDKVSVTYQNLMTKSIFITSKFLDLNISKPNSSNKNLVGNIGKDGIITSKTILSKNFNYTMDVFNPKYKSKEFQNLLKRSKKGFYKDLNAKISIINSEIKTFNQDKKTSKPASDNSMLDYSYNLTNNDLNFIINHSIDTVKGTFPIPPDLTEKINDLDGSYSKITVQVNNIGPINRDDLSKLTSISNDNNKKYLQIPNSLPARVKELAKSIAASYETDYDKVKAIETFLSNNYPYTLTPKSTPSGRDFVDYFLFDLKEGYCVYYASAMTMMVRSIGLPARYVEGFVLPAATNRDGLYDVTNQQAHAWVEVYLEGFGWIPFEPTSPFVSAFYNSNSKDLLSTSFSANPDYLEYIKGLKAYNDPGYASLAQNSQSPSKSHGFSRAIIIVTAVLSLFVVLALVYIYNYLRQRIRTIKLKNLPPEEKVIALFRSYVRMLTIFNLPIKPGETAVDYGERIDIYLLLSKPFCMRNAAKIFTSVRYGKKVLPTEEEAEYILNLKTHLENKLRKEIGTLKFIIMRYILGKV